MLENLIDPGSRGPALHTLVAARRGIGGVVGDILRWEAQAVHRHLAAARMRAVVAAQAGDLATLLRDQWELLPEDGRRLRQDWETLRARLRAR